jgi:amino acid transporter
MSESPNSKEKRVNISVAPIFDVEQGDDGIVTKSAPLARELKGRHMQMIALGNNLLLKSFLFRFNINL